MPLDFLNFSTASRILNSCVVSFVVKKFCKSQRKKQFTNFINYSETKLKMASQAVVTNYLNEMKRTGDKELAEEWGIMEELYNEK